MKILTVVGARPQLIKAAVGSRAIRGVYKEVLVHTGQHYDKNMSGVFFDELGIPAPDYNLGISGGTHGEMTGRMLIAIEDVLMQERPDALLVYGDTNSTLAAVIAAVKLAIPIIHVEAGNRTGDISIPEESNRIIADHCGRLLFCSTELSLENVAKEGLGDRAYFVGNVMYDSFLHFAELPWDTRDICDFDGGHVRVPPEYYFMTCHRPANSQDDANLTEILCAMDSLDAPTVYPVHPRNHERALRICREQKLGNILLTQPVKYSDSVHLTTHAKKIVTDSGGLQCEAFYARKKCVFVLHVPAWPEVMVDGRCELARADRRDILEKLHTPQHIDESYMPFGDGHAGEKICRVMRETLGE